VWAWAWGGTAVGLRRGGDCCVDNCAQAWQMLWTGGASDSIGGTGLHPLVGKSGCAATMRSMCAAKSTPQMRAMAYGMSGQPHTRSTDLLQDLAAFLLIRGRYAWLGWGWKGCSQNYCTGHGLSLTRAPALPRRAGRISRRRQHTQQHAARLFH
jgi:hypothetical protein